eukprot:349715-Chlamydomonas_euryale.AAC.14
MHNGTSVGRCLAGSFHQSFLSRSRVEVMDEESAAYLSTFLTFSLHPPWSRAVGLGGAARQVPPPFCNRTVMRSCIVDSSLPSACQCALGIGRAERLERSVCGERNGMP